jgi:hypothetical protein
MKSGHTTEIWRVSKMFMMDIMVAVNNRCISHETKQLTFNRKPRTLFPDVG